jgi:hypothetical protein
MDKLWIDYCSFNLNLVSVLYAAISLDLFEEIRLADITDIKAICGFVLRHAPFDSGQAPHGRLPLWS